MSLRRLLRERFWPTTIVAVLTIVVAVNLALITVALRSQPQLVTRDYYAEGYNLRRIVEREAASAATGWRISIRHLPLEPADMPLVQLTITEAGGGPCDSLVGEVAFYRPSNQALDISSCPIHPVGAGNYLVRLPRPLERGAWQALVHLSRGRQRLDSRLDFFVDP